MRTLFKKAFLTTILLASTFPYMIGASHGMQVEEEIGNRGKKKTLKPLNAMPITSMSVIEGKLKGENQKAKFHKDRITSLSSIEHKIQNKKGAIESLLKKTTPLPHDISALTPQDIDLWIETAQSGSLASVYHVGRLFHQAKKTKQPLLQPKKSRFLILEKAKNFYWWQKNPMTLVWFNPEYIYLMGVAFYRGYPEFKQDYAEAMECFFEAAARDHDYAQSYIGAFYYDGQGVAQDYQEALKWFRLAAEQNNANAQYVVGVLYHKGKGVEQDSKEAFEWFQKVPMKLQGNELFNCNFTDRDASQVASLLFQAKHLNYINLCSNKFTSQGLKIILNAFKADSSLFELNVSHNLIEDEGGKELLSFIQAHPNLKECDVSGNPMSPEMQKSIQEALKNNESRN